MACVSWGRLNRGDKEGNTPLILACREEYDEIVTSLVNAGADVLCLNNEGLKASDYSNSDEIKNLLVEAEERITCHGFKRAKIDDDDEIVAEND
jgi:ankyrin repeat protein